MGIPWLAVYQGCWAMPEGKTQDCDWRRHPVCYGHPRIWQLHWTTQELPHQIQRGTYVRTYVHVSVPYCSIARTTVVQLLHHNTIIAEAKFISDHLAYLVWCISQLHISHCTHSHGCSIETAGSNMLCTYRFHMWHCNLHIYCVMMWLVCSVQLIKSRNR